MRTKKNNTLKKEQWEPKKEEQKMDILKRLVKEESGQGLVEYVLIIALVSIICMAVLRTLGNSANSKLTDIEAEISA